MQQGRGTGNRVLARALIYRPTAPAANVIRRPAQRGLLRPPASPRLVDIHAGRRHLGEARRRRVPAFRILTDKVLRQIAIAHPATADELLAIPGIGMSTVEKYGPSIHRILNERRA